MKKREIKDWLASGLNPRIYTVSELNEEIRVRLEEWGEVWIRGEVSNLRIPGSGHCYFTLKDSESQIRVVIFRGILSQLKFELEEGREVLVLGRVGVYLPRGEYQIVGEYAEPIGVGALALALENLKRKLAREGLFDPERKRPLPPVPERIGIVTSRSGAVIRDMLRIFRDRGVKLITYLYPVRVQGEGAGEEISTAIGELNRLPLDLDLIILARGGGSLEDLWAFNEEVVARAVAASLIPVVSAVGHEIDYTISDLVSDLRAPTPTAAASLIGEGRENFADSLLQLEDGMKERIYRILEREKQTWEGIDGRLISGQPRIEEKFQRLDEESERLGKAMKSWLGVEKERLGAKVRLFESLSPLAVLNRGYSITTREDDGGVVFRAREVREGENLRVRVSEGTILCGVKGVQD